MTNSSGSERRGFFKRLLTLAGASAAVPAAAQAQQTPNEFRYLYLQSNPIAWGCGLLGVILAAILLISSVLQPPAERLQNRFLLTVFLGMYASYMIAISQLHRVMYLYHYFIPLCLCFITGVLFLKLKFAVAKFSNYLYY